MILESVNIPQAFHKAVAPSNPPRGGKYTSREWTGERWNYTYEESLKGLSVLFHADIPEGFAGLAQRAIMGVPKELSYTEAFKKALANPGKPADLKLSVTDRKLSVTVEQIKGVQAIVIRDQEGGVVKTPKKLSTKGQFDKWAIGVSNTITKFDAHGKPWLDIVPKVGSVSKETGELVPSDDKVRRWKIAYNPYYPKNDRKSGVLKTANTLDNAVAAVNKAYRAADIARGAVEDSAWFSPNDQAAKAAADSAEALIAPKNSVTDKIQSGAFSWRMTNLKKELDVSPEKKRALIDQTAQEYWPKLLKTSSTIAGTNTFFANNKLRWQAKFLGVPEIPSKIEAVSLSPGSPAYKAIERSLDNYDPRIGPFAAYLAGPKGRIQFAMRRAVDGFIEDVKRTGTLEDPTGRSVLESVSAPVGSEADFENWADGKRNLFDKWAQEFPNHQPEVLAQAKEALRKLDHLPHSEERNQYAIEFDNVLRDQGVLDFFQQKLMGKALLAIARDDLIAKATDILTKDKNVDPTHRYSHQDAGNFYYKDPKENLIRYTNAPSGHADRLSYYGDAERHPNEPDLVTNPEYFTEQGQKLTRAPNVDASLVEWNQKYNRYDPQNLWAGRWNDSVTGGVRYTYIDSDIRNYPKLQLHQQNAYTDVRIPYFRKHVAQLFTSEKLKDQITAVVLALLDQGKIRASEITSLSAGEVIVSGNLVQLRNKQVYTDSKLVAAIDALVKNKMPDEPLFSVPMQDKDGTVDQNLNRYIGPNYLGKVLEAQGISLIALQAYHSTISFCRELQRFITDFQLPWDQAISSANLAIALEWGHDLTQATDAVYTLQLINSVLVDPVAVETVKNNAEQQGLVSSFAAAVTPQATVRVPYVSLDLVDRTSEEKEFSSWLHNHPIHEHANQEDVQKALDDLVKHKYEYPDDKKGKKNGKAFATFGLMNGLFDIMKGPYRGKGTRTGVSGAYTYRYNGGHQRKLRKQEERKLDDAAISDYAAERKFVESIPGLPVSTKDAYTNAAGEYVAERRLVHKKIIDNALKAAETVSSTNAPMAVVTMGAPSVGKSTATVKLDLENYVKSDPDDVKAQLPEYQIA